MGVEPILPAWKAGAQPLGQCRTVIIPQETLLV